MDQAEAEWLVAFTKHLSAFMGKPTRIQRMNVTPLKTGYVSKAVDRLDLSLVTSDGTVAAAAFVRKACLAGEVRALEALAAVPGAEALPEVVFAWSSPERLNDPAANGFVSPFYPGSTLTFGDAIPETVMVTLGRVHALCSSIEKFEWAWSADAAHFDRTHANAVAALATSERFHMTTADPAHWQERLARIGRSKRLREASDLLPRSLTHGDMHPGNIVLRADGSPVIIDWGNACIAPPMLDLANIVAIDSPEWRTYLAAYHRAGGTIDEATSRRAYWWARAVTSLQYLPWVAEHKSDTPRMIVQIEEADEHL